MTNKNDGCRESGIEESILTELIQSVHTPESFGRALVENILKEAASKTDGSFKKLTLDAPVEISISVGGCIWVCVWGVCVRLCVGINTLAAPNNVLARK